MIVLSVFAFIDRITLIAHCIHITQSSSLITAQPYVDAPTVRPGDHAAKRGEELYNVRGLGVDIFR